MTQSAQKPLTATPPNPTHIPTLALTCFRNPNKKMSDNIPFDIQREIIKKVPDVKSLVRFRAVSKPWKCFIDSPEFIAGYGSRNTQPHSFLLRYEKAHSLEVKYVSVVDDDENGILTQQQEFAPNVHLLIKQYLSTVIGSSCGLWCLFGFTYWPRTEMVVIWNPSIRKSVGILVPCELTRSAHKMTLFGFGVSPSTYDPTVVGISGCFLQHSVTWQVGIFTLSSKTWKMIPTSNVLRESSRLLKLTPVAIHRFIYWFSQDRIVGNDGVLGLNNLILSFDLITHEFKEINLPPSLANQSSPNFSISKLRESLVVTAYTNERPVYCVWMMGEEGGVMPSFTKLFNIKTPDDSPIRTVLGFTMTGEPVIETQTDDKYVATLKVYKPCSQHINHLGISGGNGSFFISPYTETLLLVDHSDCCIISNDS